MIFEINSPKYGIKEILIDDEDYPKILLRNWHLTKDKSVKSKDKFYVVSNIYIGKKRTLIRLHKYLMNTPTGKQIDHKNGNSLDNRKENLRVCTSAENTRNMGKRCNNTVGYKGVFIHKQKYKDRVYSYYIAKITVYYKEFLLGYFKTKEQAAIAYNIAALKYHGEFAQLNNICKDNRYE